MKDKNGEFIYCEATNKICYTTKEAGAIINDCKKHSYKRWGNEPKNKPKRKYYCKDCGFFHVTHMKSYCKNAKEFKHDRIYYMYA